MEGLLDTPNGDKLLPFVRLFSGSPSTFLWTRWGQSTWSLKEEGREQGDPLMPLPLQPRSTSRFVSSCGRLRPGEHLFAFLAMCTSQAAQSGRWPVTSSKSRPNGCGVEGQPIPPKGSSRCCHLGAPVGHPDFRVSCPREENTGTQHLVGEDSSCAGVPICVGLVVCCSALQVEDDTAVRLLRRNTTEGASSCTWIPTQCHLQRRWGD